MDKESIKRLEQYGKCKVKEYEAKSKICSEDQWIARYYDKPEKKSECFTMFGGYVVVCAGVIIALTGLITAIIVSTTNPTLVMLAAFVLVAGVVMASCEWGSVGIIDLIGDIIKYFKNKKWNRTEYPALAAEWESNAADREVAYKNDQAKWTAELSKAQKKLESLGEIEPEIEEAWNTDQLDDVIKLLKRGRADTVEEALDILDEEAEYEAEERAAQKAAQAQAEAERYREAQERRARERAREQARYDCIHCALKVDCRRKWSESSIGCAAFRPKN